MLAVPKFGNDDERADAMARRVSDHLSSFCRGLAREVGLDYVLIVNINNHMNVGFGREAAASADGRRKGSPVANGMTPTAGNDTCGVTALLNSLSSVSPSCHAGYTHNLKFSRRMFTEERRSLEALLDAYWAKGGTQAMLSVVDRGEMEQAVREPGKYRNLIVRVGGFSARFVDLAPDIQQDLISRTLY